MSIKVQYRNRTAVFSYVCLDQRVSNEMITTQRQQSRPLRDDFIRRLLNFIRHFLRPTKVEMSISGVNNRKLVERIELHAIGSLPRHDG